jgi:hypothetical protein
MKRFLPLFMLTGLLFGQDVITIELKNGDKISGQVVSETESQITVKTNFGDLDIPKVNIAFIEREITENKNSVNQNVPIELNQEARWRTINSSMAIGNFLYGVGIPYVLGIEDSQSFAGFRLLMFGGGFYASYVYTRKMDLPMGRWQFQMTGAGLGGFSLLPLMAIVGFDNWGDFDEEGKIAWTYVMAAVPYGIWRADQRYKEWNLTNGQASLISQAPGLGLFNTLGALSLYYGDDWPYSENGARINTILMYSGYLAAPFLAKKYIFDKSYTEDDAYFIGISARVGFANSLLLVNILELDNIRPIWLLMLGGVNGFTYLGDKINHGKDLKRGDGKIIGLGIGASWLVWLGVATIFDMDMDTKLARVIDMATITSGWILTYNWVSKKPNKFSINQVKSNSTYLSLSPSIIASGRGYSPAISLELHF